MESLLLSGSLAMFGLLLGSFAGATVWRLRARQLADDRLTGEPVDGAEYKQLKPLAATETWADRSRCLRCGHVLAWYDLVPLVSWLSLKGRCRYCHRYIGKFEPLMELGTATVFVSSYILWPEPLLTPLATAIFGLWLCAVVLLAILFAYDYKWFLLPDQIVASLICVGIVVAILRIWAAPDVLGALVSLSGALLVLSGLYYFLYHISKKQWVGYGDVGLGFGLALLLGDWRLAFIALFSANLIGSLLVIPGMLTGKIDRKTHVPFGPLLIAGAFLAMLFGGQILDWYQTVAF